MRHFAILLATIYCAWASIEADFRPEVNRYLRELNTGGLLTNRNKRQADQSKNATYYVTQCGYNNTEPPLDSPSIEVFGGELLRASFSVPKAADLIYRMVRFMPRDLFVQLAATSSVGLYYYDKLPVEIFEEFGGMPSECYASCNRETYISTQATPYDCSQWCTSNLYPYYQSYPLNYLWGYGNFSRTFVVETNVICQPYDPSGGSENYLVREFGLTIMTRALGADKLTEITEAYENVISNDIWPTSNLINVYDYFMKGTLVWFNGVSNKDISGMNCKFFNNGAIPECVTGFHMRMYLKANDPMLYKILNKVFNNNREYAQSYTSVCDW